MEGQYDCKVKTVEMHTAGGIVRIITGGYPPICGETVLEKMAYVQENYDHLRSRLMLEPRGHSGLFGALLVSPDHPEADAGVLFPYTAGYATMCGHATIAVARYVYDHQISRLPPDELQKRIVDDSVEVVLQCPCGLVRASVKNVTSEEPVEVAFKSVPSFTLALDTVVQTEQFGAIKVDLGFGGGFYAFIDDTALKLDISKSAFEDIVRTGITIKKAVEKQIPIVHPEKDQLSFLFGVIITHKDDSLGKDYEKPSVCIFGENQADRSPCGSGTSARIAVLVTRGLMALGERKIFQNILTKSMFKGKATETAKCGEYDAVIVEIQGQPYYIGESTFFAEENDPFKNGFLLK